MQIWFEIANTVKGKFYVLDSVTFLHMIVIRYYRFAFLFIVTDYSLKSADARPNPSSPETQNDARSNLAFPTKMALD